MRCTILKPFPYAEDGIRAKDLAAGAIESIRDELVPGLIAEGFVERAPAEVDPAILSAEEEAARARADAEALQAKFAARSAVEIPEKPDALEWPALRALATQLTDDTVKSKDDALAAIAAELERRQNPT